MHHREPASHSTLEEHRRRFPALAQRVYLNHAAAGPLPSASVRAITDAFLEEQRLGASSTEVALDTERLSAAARADVSAATGSMTERIALFESISVACNVVLWGLDWRPDEQIILTEEEHPSLCAIADAISRRHGPEVVYLKRRDASKRGWTGALREALRPGTRVVVVSHVTRVSGEVLPVEDLAELCRRHETPRDRVRILVDAAQSIGHVPPPSPDAAIDYLVWTASKWLCGPPGVAGLCVTPEGLEDLRPAMVGWRGLDPARASEGLYPRQGARRLELGATATPLLAGLSQALATHERWAPFEALRTRILDLAGRLRDRLQALARDSGSLEIVSAGPGLPSGIVSFRPTRVSAASVALELERRGIVVRAPLGKELVRISVHYLNLEDEIDHLADCLRHVSRP